MTMTTPALEEYFTPRTLKCIERLRNYKPPSLPNFDIFPANRRAAVLILLFELNRDGHLRVLLTTRSKSLRSHPGQTALPGGKADPLDEDVIATALREAHEEVSLPLPSKQPSYMTVLTTLRPFLSLYKLLVTPVIVLLTHPDPNAILSRLSPNEGEVDHIFHHPLEALLDPDPTLVDALDLDRDKFSRIGGEDWPYETEWYNTSDSVWIQGSEYRMHRFRTTQTPIKGLTSDILIHTAEVAFGRSTSYQRMAPGQLPFNAAIALALQDIDNNMVAAMKKEDRERFINA